jgi:hypothetical protein
MDRSSPPAFVVCFCLSSFVLSFGYKWIVWSTTTTNKRWRMLDPTINKNWTRWRVQQKKFVERNEQINHVLKIKYRVKSSRRQVQTSSVEWVQRVISLAKLRIRLWVLQFLSVEKCLLPKFCVVFCCCCGVLFQDIYCHYITPFSFILSYKRWSFICYILPPFQQITITTFIMATENEDDLVDYDEEEVRCSV